MDFLNGLNPNLLALLITGVTTLGGWVYRKARGDKQASLKATIGGVVDNAIHLALVAVGDHPDDLRVKVLGYVWPKLVLLKIPRNAVSEAIVSELVEVAIADALQAAKDHERAIDANVAAAQASLAETAKLAAQLPGLVAAAPKLLDGMTVQVVTDPAAYEAAKAKALADEAASKLTVASGTPAIASTK